jgi:hypothetical protein
MKQLFCPTIMPISCSGANLTYQFSVLENLSWRHERHDLTECAVVSDRIRS